MRHKLWQPLAAAEGRALSPLDMCLIPWWVMIIFWLKFLVIWRFFRWAPWVQYSGLSSCLILFTYLFWQHPSAVAAMRLNCLVVAAANAMKGM